MSATSASITRHDWTLTEVTALFEQPFNDLIFQAQAVHRQHFDHTRQTGCRSAQGTRRHQQRLRHGGETIGSIGMDGGQRKQRQAQAIAEACALQQRLQHRGADVMGGERPERPAMRRNGAARPPGDQRMVVRHGELSGW